MSESATPQYAATLLHDAGVQVVRLANPSAGVSVSIAPRVGNLAFEFLVGGKNAFWFPFDSIADLAAEPQLCGNPFLSPWANRLDEHAFYAGDAQYHLNPGLGTYARDPNGLPIHGTLLFCPHWRVSELEADSRAATVTSFLDVSRHPELMAQFPFAHSIEMTYRLSGTCLEVETEIFNSSCKPLPLSVGFHPYFQLHDSPRDSWRLRLAARDVWELNEQFVPTAVTKPVAEEFPGADNLALRGRFLDHVFSDLDRDEDGWARFRLQGESETLSVAYGPQYPVAVVYAPNGDGQSFVCFEPMTGVTNAFNLAHRGLYDALPWIQPDATWHGRYRIEVDGF